MLPLAVLFLATLASRLGGWISGADWLDRWTTSVRIGLAVMFALMASAHFVQPRRRQLADMVPPRFGHAGALVTITGLLEVAGAVGVLIPVTSRLAALCLALLLVAMYPANVHAARAKSGIRTLPLPVRTAVQFVLIATCLFVAFA